MYWKIIKRLVKEFWFPFLVGASWAAYKAPDWKDFDWADLPEVVAHFGSSFFLASFFVGQFFRVQKVTKDGETFVQIQQRLEHLVQDLEAKTKQLTNMITGGDSFCHFLLPCVDKLEGTGCATLIHGGEFPMFDVHLNVMDLDDFERYCADGLPFSVAKEKSGYRFGHASLMPGTQVSFGNRPLDVGRHYRRLVIEGFARNGHTVQQLRIVKYGDEWLFASRVFRAEKIIAEVIDERFPSVHLESDDIWNSGLTLHPAQFNPSQTILG